MDIDQLPADLLILGDIFEILLIIRQGPGRLPDLQITTAGADKDVRIFFILGK